MKMHILVQKTTFWHFVVNCANCSYCFLP